MDALLAELDRYARHLGVNPDHRYPYSYGSTRLTIAQMVQRQQIAQLHPEFLRRVLHLMVFLASKGIDYGIGGGSRDYDAQLAEALRRHTRNPALARVPWRTQWWEGKRYWLRRGMASYAFPGSSNHEEGATPGGAIAVDTVPSPSWARANEWVGAFGLKHFTNVNSEPWHLQPAEWPNSRRNVDTIVAAGGTLDRRSHFPGVPIPTNPTPSPITETGADEMAYQYHQRVYDSRENGYAGVTHEVKVHDGPCNAKLNVSVIANERGSFAVAGGDDRDRALTSAAGNFDPDGVTNASVEVGTPDGRVWVQCSAPAHVVIDVQGIQAIG